MSVDTTVNLDGRVLLGAAPSGKTHWLYEGLLRGKALVPHCGWITEADWPREYGSAAAITCVVCARLWAREQQG